MLLNTALLALVGLAAVSEASTLHESPFRLSRRTNRSGSKDNGGKSGGGASSTANAAGNVAAGGSSNTCLAANAVQTGSFVTGQENDVPADGQSNSAT